MDKIRARSLLKYHYVYNPPINVADDIISIAKQHGFNTDQKDSDFTEIKEIDRKAKYFIDLGQKFKHFIPNSKLHKMKSFKDLIGFYSTKVNNITKYSEMARSETLPKNLAILENPRRFHPNDKSAPHGGITATPGEGGKVFGIRSRRLYREFKSKKDWFDYEEENFNYDPDFSKGMPWDDEIARKMDSHSDIRFTKDYLKKIK